MHHSSATMCSTRRQLPAPALAAAIPKHPRLRRPRSAGLSARRRRAVSAPTARGVPGCAGRSRPARHPPLSIPPGASCLKSRPRLARLGRGWRGFHRLLAAAAACRHMPRGYRSGKEAGRRSRPGQRRLSLSRCVARALAGRRVLGSTKNSSHGCLCGLQCHMLFVSVALMFTWTLTHAFP